MPLADEIRRSDVMDGGTSSNANNITYNNIEKLQGIANYLNWKFSIRMLLTLDGVWNCVDGTDSDAARDGRALARICLSIQPNLYQFVRDAKTSKEAWKRLSDTFEDKGLYRKVLLLRQLHRTEYNQYPNMSDYIEGVMSLVAQLSDIGKIIEDGEIAEILLSGLPEQFDVLVSSLETASLTNNLTSEVVRTRLLQEDHRRNSNNIDGSAYLANKKKPNKLTCSYCKKSGHIAKRCFKKKREEKGEKQEELSLFASAYSACSSDEFIVDSGATVHMCVDSKLVQNAKQKKCTISVANGEHLMSESLGKVSLKSNVSLENVLFVPSLSNNLMSVSAMTDKGYVVTFHNNECKIYSDCKITGNQVLTARKSNGLFKFKVQGRPTSGVGYSPSLPSMQGTESANAAACVPMSVWHKRLGHLSQKGMSVLGGGNQCVGVVFQQEDGVPGSCVSCLTGKMHESSFPRATARRAAAPLELIHSDVCGPMQVSSWGGARYLLTFTDDKTRKTFGFLMKNKSEISNVSSRCLYHRVARRFSAESRAPSARRGRNKRRRAGKRVNYRESVWGKQISSQIIGGASEREMTSKYYKPSITDIPEKLESSIPKEVKKVPSNIPAIFDVTAPAHGTSTSAQNSEEELYNTMLSKLRRSSTNKKNTK